MSERNKQLYALIHKIVRNDEHCPVCRRYYITVYDNLDDLYKYLDQIHLEQKDLDILKATSRVWVDEWVRRRNGDLYVVTPVILDEEFIPRNPPNPIIKTQIYQCNYMLLNIMVDQEEYCPDNIVFRISFHNELSKVSRLTSNEDVDSESDSSSEEELESAESSDLLALNPVWKNLNTSGSKGRHRQIIPVIIGEKIYLNGYCDQISEDEWCK